MKPRDNRAYLILAVAAAVWGCVALVWLVGAR